VAGIQRPFSQRNWESAQVTLTQPVSSEKSPQSFSESHLKLPGMQRPVVHWNSPDPHVGSAQSQHNFVNPFNAFCYCISMVTQIPLWKICKQVASPVERWQDMFLSLISTNIRYTQTRSTNNFEQDILHVLCKGLNCEHSQPNQLTWSMPQLRWLVTYFLTQSHKPSWVPEWKWIKLKFNYRANLMETVADEVALGQVYLKILQFLPTHNHFTYIPY
jgi:hypothetical protein